MGAVILGEMYVAPVETEMTRVHFAVDDVHQAQITAGEGRDGE